MKEKEGREGKEKERRREEGGKKEGRLKGEMYWCLCLVASEEMIAKFLISRVVVAL